MASRRLTPASAMFFVLLLAGCAGGKAAPASAADLEGPAGTVRGIVIDPEQVVIAGATVTIASGKALETQLNTTTNEMGRFDFGRVPVGDWYLLSTAPGFEVTSQNVSVQEDVDVQLRLQLQP